MDRHQKRVLRLRNHVLNKSEVTEPDTREDNEDSNAIVLGDVTKPEIMEQLDLRGVEYNPRDKKETLYELLVKDE